MATDSDVMKEFLVSLGFKIDEAGMKKFISSLAGSNKAALGVGTALVGAAFAVEKFVETMANGMEKLYFASERTHASAANLRVVDQAFQQIGFSAGASTEFIEKMSENIRISGGAMADFIKGQFGIDPTTMDRAQAFEEVMVKLANLAKESPAARGIAGGWANMLFGMNDRDFENIVNHTDEFVQKLEAARAKMRENNAEFQKIAAQSHEFNNALRDMGQEVTDIATQIEGKLLPSATKWAKAMTGDLDALRRHDFWGFFQNQVDAMNYFLHGIVDNPRGPTEADKRRERDPGRVRPEDIFAGIEKAHGLAPGTLMAVRDVESSGGTQLEGPKQNGQQSFGPFMISNSNFKRLGITKEDAMDPSKGGEAWASMFERNLQEFKGDYVKAIAATNSNPQHVREAVQTAMTSGGDWIQYMGRETQEFLVKIDKSFDKYKVGRELVPARKTPDGSPQANSGAANVTINQNIEVNGSGNPDATGRAIAQHTKRLYGDAIRDSRGLSATPGRSA